MVRADLLRAKSIQAEVSYLTEIKRLGDVKRQEQQLGAIAQKKERQFWNEAVRAAAPNKEGAPSMGANAAASAERMWNAHGQLKDAHVRHAATNQKLQEGLVQVSLSSKRVEILQTLLTKASRQRAQRIESRSSEEITDLAVALKSMRSEGGGASLSKVTSKRPPVDEAVEGLERGSESKVETRSSFGGTIDPMSTRLAAPMAPAITPVVDSAPVMKVEALSQPQPVEVHALECSNGAKVSQLSIQCSLGANGPVTLSLVKREGEGLKVVIDPSASGLAGQISRDKSVIQSRLQAMGIKVSSLEVGQSDAADPNRAGMRRGSRRLFEDDDETTFA